MLIYWNAFLSMAGFHLITTVSTLSTPDIIYHSFAIPLLLAKSEKSFPFGLFLRF